MNSWGNKFSPPVRALLIADFVLAVVELCFALPNSFVPKIPNHYWTESVLAPARYQAVLYALMAILSIAAWSNRRLARAALIGVIALIAIRSLNAFRVSLTYIAAEMAASRLDVAAMLRAPLFWLDIVLGLFPVAWLVLNWKYLGFDFSSGRGNRESA